MERGDRWRALVASTVVVVAVAIPGARTLVDEDAPDGFPLSTYPMFSRDRGRVVELPTVVAVRGDGTVERLSPATIAATDQVMQASAAVRLAVADGPSAARALCREVAARLADRSPPTTEAAPGGDPAPDDPARDDPAQDDPAADDPAAVASVQVVVERHDSIAWSAGRREPLDRRTVATCGAS